jgi:hypothetical protein
MRMRNTITMFLIAYSDLLYFISNNLIAMRILITISFPNYAHVYIQRRTFNRSAYREIVIPADNWIRLQ